MKTRHAQGMPMNVIIIAALALILMFVLIAIFTGKIQIVGSESQCKTRGGTCIDSSATCDGVRTGYACASEQVCCVKPGEIS